MGSDHCLAGRRFPVEYFLFFWGSKFSPPRPISARLMNNDNSIQSSDVIVLGAGVSGLTAANELSSRGNSVRLLDQYALPGGNHLSKDFGDYTFDIGAIFFWTDSPLINLFPGIENHWTPVEYDLQRIAPSGNVLKYPMDVKREIIEKSPTYIVSVVADLLMGRLFSRKNSSAADFARHYIGVRLLKDSGLANYLARFYGLPIDEISYAFAKRRMRWISENASIRSHAHKIIRIIKVKLRLSEKTPDLKCFARPRGGFQVMYNHAAQILEKRGVICHFGSSIMSIVSHYEGFSVTTSAGVFSAKRLVNTMPLNIVCDFAGMADDTKVESSALVTLCYRFRGERGFSAVVLYNFHESGAWKRLTMLSDYYGAEDGWEYFGVEVTSRDNGVTAEALDNDFRSSVQSHAILVGDMELLGSFRTEFAYPVYDRMAADRKAKMMNYLGAIGVESIGRQGDFDYIPSATEAVMAARNSLKE